MKIELTEERYAVVDTDDGIIYLFDRLHHCITSLTTQDIDKIMSILIDKQYEKALIEHEQLVKTMYMKNKSYPQIL